LPEVTAVNAGEQVDVDLELAEDAGERRAHAAAAAPSRS